MISLPNETSRQILVEFEELQFMCILVVRENDRTFDNHTKIEKLLED